MLLEWERERERKCVYEFVCVRAGERGRKEDNERLFLLFLGRQESLKGSSWKRERERERDREREREKTFYELV